MHALPKAVVGHLLEDEEDDARELFQDTDLHYNVYVGSQNTGEGVGKNFTANGRAEAIHRANEFALSLPWVRDGWARVQLMDGANACKRWILQVKAQPPHRVHGMLAAYNPDRLIPHSGPPSREGYESGTSGTFSGRWG